MTSAKNQYEGWENLLQRPFKGLNPGMYEEPFTTMIEDHALKKAALASLKKAGDDQQFKYDFSAIIKGWLAF